MTTDALISEIFRYSELNEITESLDILAESLSNDVRNWFREDPNRLSLKKQVAFNQFLNDYPSYSSTDKNTMISRDSTFGKERKKLLGLPIDPNTNTLAIPAKSETNSAKIVRWIKENPTAKFNQFILEFPEMNTDSNRTIFNKARVSLGLNKKPVAPEPAPAPIVEPEEETSENNYDGIPLEDEEDEDGDGDETPAVDPNKTLVTAYQGKPISERSFVIHEPEGAYPTFDSTMGRSDMTIYPKELVSSGEVASIRYYLSNFGLTRDQINDFITNLIYDKKWAHQLDPDTQFDIIKDAVNGNNVAIKLLFLACFQNIAYNYTAGPTAFVRAKGRRISGDDKANYLSIAFNTLNGNFNPKSEESGNALHPKKGPLTVEDLLGNNEYPFINFGTRYSQLLQSAIREQLKIDKADGITGTVATSNKTLETYKYIAATWKDDNRSSNWDEFVSDNPYAVWEKFYPGPITAEHSLDNTEITDPDKLKRRQLAFKRAQITTVKNVSYDVTAANMDMDNSNSRIDTDPFVTSDKEVLSKEFLQDINDLIHDKEYTDNVNKVLEYILTELQSEEQFRLNNPDETYKVGQRPMSSATYNKSAQELGKLFSKYNILSGEFKDNVHTLSPGLVLNFIRNHR